MFASTALIRSGRCIDFIERKRLAAQKPHPHRCPRAEEARLILQAWRKPDQSARQEPRPPTRSAPERSLHSLCPAHSEFRDGLATLEPFDHIQNEIIPILEPPI